MDIDINKLPGLVVMGQRTGIVAVIALDKDLWKVDFGTVDDMVEFELAVGYDEPFLADDWIIVGEF